MKTKLLRMLVLVAGAGAVPDRIGIKHYGYAPPEIARPYVMLEER